MALSAVGFAVMAVLVKRLAPTVPQFELVFFRSSINFTVAIAALAITRASLFPREGKRLLIGRGLAGFAGLTCLFFSVAHLPLSIAMLLSWCAPIFVLFFSALFLKERLHAGQLGSIAVALVGLVLLLQPDPLSKAPHSGLPPLPVFIGIIGAAFSALAYVAVRKATARVDANVIITYFVGLSTLLSAPLALRTFQIPSGGVALELLFMGLSGTLGQFAMTQGYRWAPAGVVSAMSILNAAFSALFGWILFGETLNAVQWIGIGILGAAIAYLSTVSARLTPSGKTSLACPQG